MHAGEPKLVELLIERGAELNPAKGRPPLHAAVARGDEAMVRLLVKQGADLEGTNEHHRRTPLQLAKRRGLRPKMVALLLELGAKDDPEQPAAR